MEKPEAQYQEVVKGKDDDALFPDINSENPVTELESLCMNCEEQVCNFQQQLFFLILSQP